MSGPVDLNGYERSVTPDAARLQRRLVLHAQLARVMGFRPWAISVSNFCFDQGQTAAVASLTDVGAPSCLIVLRRPLCPS